MGIVTPQTEVAVTLNVSLLQSSLELVLERQPQLTTRFYEILFERHPELAPLFDERRRDAQARMLGEALVAVVDHLEDAPWLENTLGALGARHVDYGVTPAMYDQVGQSLLAALAEAAGPAWNRELELAWGEAYGAIRHLMLAGVVQSSRVAALP